MDGLLVDEHDDGLGQIFLWLNLLGEVLGFDSFVNVYVHRQVVSFYPFFGHSAQLARLGVLCNFDS